MGVEWYPKLNMFSRHMVQQRHSMRCKKQIEEGGVSSSHTGMIVKDLSNIQSLM